MTELLYHTDSYLREFEAEVSEVDTENRRLVLDRTAFYPGGGGQPHDLGSLDGTPVTKVKTDSGRVWHWLGEGELPTVGSEVAGELDWERRYRLMRTHTALHVLCGVIWRDHRAQVTGGNMEPGRGRLDFELESLGADMVPGIEEACRQEVAAAREIRVQILPRQEAMEIPDLIRTKINLLPPGIAEIRTVEIVGLDLQADGGTHVANTSEVGELRIVKYRSKGATNKRLYLEV
ncbi:MAG: alanyl-tRNA editing protein [Acidobacteria bacterium]|nr:MAG: alanyl-tRNA editing protein [Acidobacteriota bacterium]